MHKKGFTLLELVISLGIFMIFTTAVISSFLSLTQSTTKANINREQVSEANQIFEYIEQIAKENAVDYKFLQTSQQTPNIQTYGFISGDQLTRHLIKSTCPDSSAQSQKFCQISSNTTTRSNISRDFIIDESMWTPLHSDTLKIVRFQIKTFPQETPFTTNQPIQRDIQFQPLSHIILNLARNTEDNYQEALNSSTPITLQTSISSRSYNNS
jgi:Tfp pilus assembly protein PilE